MNNIFQKNIEAVAIKNKELALKLTTFIPTDVPQLINENGAYNLTYKSKTIHSQIYPLEQAQKIFSAAKNSPASIHVVYGLGLGYLFQTIAKNSKGQVILFEPDLNILKTTLMLVDFSKDFAKENVYVCNTFEDLSQIIYRNSGTYNSPELISLPTQKEIYPTQFEELVSRLQTTIGRFSMDLKYTQTKFYPSLKKLLSNIPSILEELPLTKFQNAYNGKTALIISAGPTLDKNINTIKKYRDNVIIFTVGTAAKTLFANGIRPDFVCIIETYDSSKQLMNLDLSDVYFITEPYANQKTREFKFKQRLSHIASNSPINEFWAEICGENLSEYYSKGTVSYTALNSARILGCNKIVLVGQDLAYIEGQCYSKESAYKDLLCEYNDETKKWEIRAKDFSAFSEAISNSNDPKVREKAAINRLKSLNASLHFIKGINGDMIPTESVYAAFIEPLSEFTHMFPEICYINTSLVGAQIDGFQNLSLEEALKDSTSCGDLTLLADFSYDKNKIFVNLECKFKELNQVLNIIDSGAQYAKNLISDLKRYKSVTPEILKSLKKLSLIYLKLSSEVTNKSKMFDFITISDRINLDYEMKILQNFDFDSVFNISTKIYEYMLNAKIRIKEVNAIYESINPKS